jgi:3' exoribonuclease family, domain 1
MGTTVVLCHVRAPVVAASIASNQYYGGSSGSLEGNAELETGILACSVHLAPHHHVATMMSGNSSHSGSGSNPGILQLRKIERSLERQLHQAVAPSVPLSQYAKSAVLLQLTVVSAGEHLTQGGSGGGGGGLSAASQLLCPCVMAATLAMADAGVELYDLVTCGRVALRSVEDVPSSSSTSHPAAIEILVDPTSEEEEEAAAVLTVANMSAWKEITYWNQQQSSGAAVISSDAMNDAAEYCLDLHQEHPPTAASHGG